METTTQTVDRSAEQMSFLHSIEDRALVVHFQNKVILYALQGISIKEIYLGCLKHYDSDKVEIKNYLNSGMRYIVISLESV